VTLRLWRPKEIAFWTAALAEARGRGGYDRVDASLFYLTSNDNRCAVTCARVTVSGGERVGCSPGRCRLLRRGDTQCRHRPTEGGACAGCSRRGQAALWSAARTASLSCYRRVAGHSQASSMIMNAPHVLICRAGSDGGAISRCLLLTGLVSQRGSVPPIFRTSRGFAVVVPWRLDACRPGRGVDTISSPLTAFRQRSPLPPQEEERLKLPEAPAFFGLPLGWRRRPGIPLPSAAQLLAPQDVGHRGIGSRDRRRDRVARGENGLKRLRPTEAAPGKLFHGPSRSSASRGSRLCRRFCPTRRRTVRAAALGRRPTALRRVSSTEPQQRTGTRRHLQAPRGSAPDWWGQTTG
jgi:hypothetical protein